MTDTTKLGLDRQTRDELIGFLKGRPQRPDLTPQEKERMEKYGAIEFKSAGATRKR